MDDIKDIGDESMLNPIEKNAGPASDMNKEMNPDRTDAQHIVGISPSDWLSEIEESKDTKEHGDLARNTVKVENADRNSWGYIVGFGTVISFIAGIGHVNSMGLIYNDFMNETNSTAKSLTSAHGVFAIMLAIGGIILNSVTKRFSLRFGGLIGAVLLSSGAFSTILISNTNQLPISFGVLQGIGFGMVVPVCYSTLNHYFLRKRTTVMSICKAIQGIILMWYPQVLRKIMNDYGFRGTLLIVAGISLHVFPGMITMKIYKKTNKKIRTII